MGGELFVALCINGSQRLGDPQVYGIVRPGRRRQSAEAKEGGATTAPCKRTDVRSVSVADKLRTGAEDSYATDQRYSLDRLTITSKGFQFLLEERQTQLWQILIYYLTLQEVRLIPSVYLCGLTSANRSKIRYSSVGVLQLGVYATWHGQLLSRRPRCSAD